MSPMSPRLLRPRASGFLTDADARTYVAAVELADGQKLEKGVAVAIQDFIRGCKADGTWSAIKASCILMGARTLSGALTPLVGTAPTNNNFVSGDYNRKTGLVGNGSTKMLSTGRNNNADPQNSRHVSLYVTTAATSSASAFPTYIGAGGGGNGATNIGRLNSNSTSLYSRISHGAFDTITSAGSATGFIGSSRASSADYTFRHSGATSTVTRASQSPISGVIHLLNDTADTSGNSYANARVAFYSVGESLTLALLDSRLTTLYTAIGAAIP